MALKSGAFTHSDQDLASFSFLDGGSVVVSESPDSRPGIMVSSLVVIVFASSLPFDPKPYQLIICNATGVKSLKFMIA